MSENRAKKQNIWVKVGIEAAIYATVFLLAILAYWTVKPLIAVQSRGFVAQVIMGLAILLCLGFVAYMGATKRLTTRTIILVLMIIGLIMRLGYVLYTPATYRQHDTFSKNFDGHEAYAWTIFSTGKLPTTNKYQFYHPPLNALLQAGFMKFSSALANLFSLGGDFFTKFSYGKPDYVDAERYFLYSTCQILGVMYSVVTMVAMVKIVGMFAFSDKAKLFAVAIVVLYPRNIHMAGMLNNDGVAYMAAILALYFALKWWKQGKKLQWILPCGVSIGLGMMAKLSSATVCMPIAGIFIYEFILTLRKKEGALPFWKMAVQYGAFLCVCAPIGLWFQVYAKQRFGQDFGYVWNNLTDRLYTGDKSWFARFVFPFDASEFFGRVYCYSFDNYYLFNFALRSSIFGEQSYTQGTVFAALSVFMAYIAAIALATALVWCIVAYVRKCKNKNAVLLGEQKPTVSFADFLFVFLLLQSQVISEIYFYISMPYGCTMDFRYIMPMILSLGLTVGCVHKTLAAEGGKASLVINRVLLIAVAAFLACSTLFYLTCA